MATEAEGLTVEGQLQLLVGADDEDRPDGQGQVSAVLVGGVQHAVCAHSKQVTQDKID